MNSLKYLPWRSLFLAAILAVITMKAIDFLLWKSFDYTASSSFAELLSTKMGNLLFLFCEGLAVGGFGVLYLERVGRVGPIYASTLWALVLCLLISLWLGTFVRIAGLGLVDISELSIMSVILGVFWRGRPYWR
ncbi:MAG: hypothetical protein HC852_21385 [Acaryochloridaceae cyanobacterium RU_4_10]|nr:hypothetical protein [Acaryochloridaceae cyanobacterium RU_4_10]